MTIFIVIESLSGGGAERVSVDLAHNIASSRDVFLVSFTADCSYDLPNSFTHISLNVDNWLDRSLITKLRQLWFKFQPNFILSNTRNVTTVCSQAFSLFHVY